VGHADAGWQGRLRPADADAGVAAAYVAAILPFRHLIVYLQMLRQIERAWRGVLPAANGGRRSTPAGRGGYPVRS
jgi:hypothetical protein